MCKSLFTEDETVDQEALAEDEENKEVFDDNTAEDEIFELVNNALVRKNTLSQYMKISIGDILKRHNWDDKKSVLINQLEHEIGAAVSTSRNTKKQRSKKNETSSVFRESFENSFAEFMAEQNRLEQMVNPDLFAMWAKLSKNSDGDNSSRALKERPYARNLLFTSEECDWSFLYKICRGPTCLKLFPLLVVMLLCNTNDNLFRRVRSALKMNKTSVLDKRYVGEPISIVNFMTTTILEKNKDCIRKNTNNAVFLLLAKFFSLVKLEVSIGHKADCGLCLAWLFDIFPELELYFCYEELSMIKALIFDSLEECGSDESLVEDLWSFYRIGEDADLSDIGIKYLGELDKINSISRDKLTEVYYKYDLLKHSDPLTWKYLYINTVTACRSIEQNPSIWIPNAFASLGLKARAKSIFMENENIFLKMDDECSYALKDFEFVSFDRESVYEHYRSAFGWLFYSGDLEINGTIKINKATVMFRNESICNISSKDFMLNNAYIHQFEFIGDGVFSVQDPKLLPFLFWIILCSNGSFVKDHSEGEVIIIN